MQIGISAYLARVGLPIAPEPDAEGLIALQRAHRMAIPFENLDIPLGRGISLDPDDVFDKLVVRRRGGYCFEHNSLFLRVLSEIGFEARPLLGRVLLGYAEVQPRTHTLSLAVINGEPWIADPGFGASYTPPMQLFDGSEASTPDGARHRITKHADHGWILERLGAAETMAWGGGHHEDWLPQYSFTLDPVWPSDLILGNLYTSTYPASRFMQHAVATIVLPNGFASLIDRRYSRASLKGRETTEIESTRAYRIRLSLLFGLDLTEDEVRRLGLFE